MGKRERERSSSTASSSSFSRKRSSNKAKRRKDVFKEKEVDVLAQTSKHMRDGKKRDIGEYRSLERKGTAQDDNADTDSSGADTLDTSLWRTNTDPLGTNEEDSSSSLGSDSSRFGHSENDDDTTDGDGDDVRERLFAHAKATSLAMKATDSLAFNVELNAKMKAATGSAAALLKGEKQSPVAVMFQQLATELKKPVPLPMSTALVAMNAADESAQVLSSVVEAKLPPTAPAEAKKLRRLQYVDHNTIAYPPIRKDFYVVPPDVHTLSVKEIKELLRELDGAKIRGRDPPRPLRRWDATGLPDPVLDVLHQHKFDAPFAVQCIGAACLMSGRDLIITAKTGSGKTLAYALPLVRHCIDQPRCGKGEGPIGLVLVPTQELAAQVHGVLNELCSAAGIRAVASYGSTSLADNISAAKVGCEVMTCTPGRLLDLLTVNGGHTVTLQRVSFVVIDEADRLFDSGFMEHVEAFLKNIRPDRQVAMISATMPKELSKIVAAHMKDALEITVGGKPTPASNVEQLFYFFDEDIYEVDETKRRESGRFVKLMQILGDESDGGGEHLILIFVQRREEVNEVMAKLSALGYNGRIATLYSGMDPIDREFALEHFTPGNQFILVATAVAERGLDIPYLDLVINYTLPNHYEAYVHRIGRTGRAGRKGRAISFYVRGKDDDIAPELVDGLVRAEQHVPEELFVCSNKVRELRREGKASHQASFYRGYLKSKKQRFAARGQKDQIREAAKAAGLDGFLSSTSEEETDSDTDRDADAESEIVPVSASAAAANMRDTSGSLSSALTLHRSAGRGSSALVLSTQQEDRIAKALAFAEKTTKAVTSEGDEGIRFQAEYAINDLPDVVRGKLQSSSFLRGVMEETNTYVIKKGVYYDPKYRHSHRLKEGERSLYLLLIGRTPEDVQNARRSLNAMKEEMLSKVRAKVSATGAVL